jgi:hypothetical protein
MEYIKYVNCTLGLHNVNHLQLHDFYVLAYVPLEYIATTRRLWVMNSGNIRKCTNIVCGFRRKNLGGKINKFVNEGRGVTVFMIFAVYKIFSRKYVGIFTRYTELQQDIDTLLLRKRKINKYIYCPHIHTHRGNINTVETYTHTITWS